MTPNWTWRLKSQKYSIYTEAQILVRFALRLAVSKIQYVQGRRKSVMHHITPNSRPACVYTAELDAVMQVS